MLNDALLTLVPFVSGGTGLSLVAGAGVPIPSPGIIDLIGDGPGTPPTNTFGNSALFGSDVGIGGKRPQLDVVIGTGLVTGNGATLNCALQIAPDTGAGGGYLPGTWQTIVETGPLTAAQCVAGTVIARFDFMPAFPANLRPRFMRLLFETPAGEDFSAGSIAYANITMVRDDQANKFAPRNYTV